VIGMEGSPQQARWRVGHLSDPLGFVAVERCSWNHRFDDPRRRFRTLYCALRPETALREVLADLRPNATQLADYARAFGADALADLPRQAITASWRRQHQLVECRIDADRTVVDLTDPAVREEIAREHAALLAHHGTSAPRFAGDVGLVLDNAITFAPSDLTKFGFQRPGGREATGPARRNGDHSALRVSVDRDVRASPR
jgi:hypothetical protein